MKQKIIGIFICMLLITTAVSAVNSLKNNVINSTISNIPLKSMAGSWTETQKLLANDGVANDCFGYPVFLDGDTAFIGAMMDDNYTGSVFVFTRSGTTWIQKQKLVASDGESGDYFGAFVSIDGDTAFIGADGDNDNGDNSGSTYVFTRSGTTWIQQQKLLASDGEEDDWFGHCVSISGDTALIGAQSDDDNGYTSGSVYVFTRSGTTWIQQQKLLASDGEEGDQFGYSISLYSDSVFIGAPFHYAKGSVYVFTLSGTTWIQQQKLLSSDGEEGDNFGISVSLSGESGLIGARGDNTGSAYLFTRIDTTWTQQAKLFASDGAEEDWFGCSVSLLDDTALIGARNHDENGIGSGSAYVFTRSGTTWSQQQELLPSDGLQGDDFGWSVSLNDDIALIGAVGTDDKGVDSGSAYVFTKVLVPILDLIDIKGGMLGISVILTNFGEGTAADIYWEMSASGGLFYPKSKSGTIDELYPGQTEIIKISPVGGFGKATINFYCKYKIVNLPYDVDFEVKQEWRNRAIIFLHSFPNKIQPDKQWMEINDYSYFSRSGTPGVELYFEGINNMHNVRVVLGSDSFSQEIEFIAACKFTDGIGILKECWLTKEMVSGGIAHWELELVDGE